MSEVWGFRVWSMSPIGALEEFAGADGDLVGARSHAALLRQHGRRGHYAVVDARRLGPGRSTRDRSQGGIVWDTKDGPREYVRAKTGRLIPCPGEAHRNPHIDNCGFCAPRWGEIDELAPIDFFDARESGLDVRIPDIEEHWEWEMMMAIRSAGFATMVNVTRKRPWGTQNYNVLRWELGS